LAALPPDGAHPGPAQPGSLGVLAAVSSGCAGGSQPQFGVERSGFCLAAADPIGGNQFLSGDPEGETQIGDPSSPLDPASGAGKLGTAATGCMDLGEFDGGSNSPVDRSATHGRLFHPLG